MSNINKEIGLRIRAIRDQERLTQTELGKILGVEKATVSKYESGETKVSPENLKKIADIGEKSLDWLIAGVERDQLNRQVHGLAEGGADAVLWRALIETVEEHLQSNKANLAPAKKAELITTLYEMFSEEEGKQVDKKTVGKLIKLAM